MVTIGNLFRYLSLELPYMASTLSSSLLYFHRFIGRSNWDLLAWVRISHYIVVAWCS